MRRTTAGFTLIELVIALLIGSILTSVALASFGNSRGRFAVRGARTTFASLHARARAQAIELGENVRVIVDVVGDSVLLVDNSATVLEKMKFDEEFNVDLRSTSNFRICMSPRGYAEESCNSYTSTVTLQFWAGADSTSLKILPLGQLVY